jgi:hypothetical protein
VRVKALKAFKHDDQVSGKFYAPEVDDEFSCPDDLGRYFCKAGWVEDLSGEVPTEVPDPNKPVLLDVQPITNTQKAETVNG